MSFYELLMNWLLPLCWPLAIGATAAFVTRSRLMFVVPVVGALFSMAVLPAPRVYELGRDRWSILQSSIALEAAHMHVVALITGLLLTLASLVVGPSVAPLCRRWYRSPPEADRLL